MNKNKEALEKAYQMLRPFSDPYRADFKRFLFSLDLLSGRFLIKDKRILDIGSGIGIMVMALQNLGADINGVDKFIFSDENENFHTISDFDKLEYIWERENIKIIKSDIVTEKLPFKNDLFDAVICDATIEHLPESPKRLFHEVRRVLKNGGIFLATTPNLANLLRRFRFLLGRSSYWDIKDFFESSSNFKGHRREYTLGELVKMLEWSSFEIIEKKDKNVFLNPRRFLNARKMLAQFCGLLSWPIPTAREMIYVLVKKI